MGERRSRHYEPVLVGLLVLFWGVVGLNRLGIGIVFPRIVPEFHLSLTQAGLLISGTSVTWAVSSWAGGWLSDRHGRRRVLLPAAPAPTGEPRSASCGAGRSCCSRSSAAPSSAGCRSRPGSTPCT